MWRMEHWTVLTHIVDVRNTSYSHSPKDCAHIHLRRCEQRMEEENNTIWKRNNYRARLILLLNMMLYALEEKCIFKLMRSSSCILTADEKWRENHNVYINPSTSAYRAIRLILIGSDRAAVIAFNQKNREVAISTSLSSNPCSDNGNNSHQYTADRVAREKQTITLISIIPRCMSRAWNMRMKEFPEQIQRRIIGGQNYRAEIIMAILARFETRARWKNGWK